MMTRLTALIATFWSTRKLRRFSAMVITYKTWRIVRKLNSDPRDPRQFSKLVCMWHPEEALRHTWSAWGAGNAGLLKAFLRSSTSARKLHTGCESVRCTYGTGATLSDACMQHNYKTSRYSSTTLSVLSRELGTTLY